jgi:hypothetical protein
MLAYGLVSIGILAFSYFVIIKPITDNANNQVNSALDTVNQQLDQNFGNSGSSSSGTNATADDVYNACVDAIKGSATPKSTCASARNTFAQCASAAASAGGLAGDTALKVCQNAANQVVAGLKSGG